MPILHLAPAWMVVNKPAGLAVHPGPRTPESLESLLDELRFGYTETPSPAHRLDRDTSGCLLLARRVSARRKLGALFERHAILKTYWAIVDGAPPQETGLIDAALRKTSSPQQGWRMIVDPKAGQAARTSYRVLASDGARSWLELTPETGRTHQLRVHCAHIGCPIAGDPVYGRSEGPMLLHARSLAIPWDDGKPPVVITADAPPAFQSAATSLSSAAISSPM